jgi:hypothetical protein
LVLWDGGILSAWPLNKQGIYSLTASYTLGQAYSTLKIVASSVLKHSSVSPRSERLETLTTPTCLTRMDFFHRPTVEETVKETKRDVSRTQRSLGRDSAQLTREEQVLKAKIKDAEKRGNVGEMKVLARQVVQLRKEQEKLSKMSANLGQVKNQATMMKATHAMSTAMGKTAKTMKQMNKVAGGDKMQANMQQYQQQMAHMEMNEEMMDDMLSGAFDDEVDEEADEIVRQTLDELGVDATKALGPAPAHRVKEAEDDELEAETNKLMKELLGKTAS